jgi:amino acid transporter
MEGTLKRDYNVWPLVLMSVVGAVGTGVLFGTAGIAAEAGPAVILDWILAGIIYLPIAFLFAQLAKRYPEAGGPARYPHYTHGFLANLVAGVSDLVWFLLIPPIEALAVVEGINSFYPHFLNSSGDPTATGALVAVLLVLAFFPFNYFGITAFRRSTTWLGLVKTFFYMALALSLVSVGFGSNLSRYGGFMPYGVNSLLPGIALAAFGIGGVKCVLNFMEEMNEPHKIRQVIFLSVAGQIVINVSFGLAIVLGLNWHSAHLRSGNWAGVGTLPGNPFLVIVRDNHTHWLVPVVALVAILGPFVTGYIYEGSGLRVLVAMGRGRVSPVVLGKISSRHQIPARALGMFTAVAVVLAFLTAPVPQIYGLINDAVVAGYFSMVCLSACLLAAIKNSAPHRPPGVGVMVLAALGVCSTSFICYWSGWPSVPYSMVLIAILSVVFMFARAKGESLDLRNGIWLVAEGAFLVLMSAIGSVGKFSLVSLPVGTLIVGLGSILIFLPWGYASRIRGAARIEQLNDESLELQKATAV